MLDKGSMSPDFDLTDIGNESFTNVTESMTSTMYEIVRPCTILPDDDSHKVTVAIIDLVPEFLFETIPRLASYAFLKAFTKNTSSYVMLAGGSNIFLDNCFVSKVKHDSHCKKLFHNEFHF